MRIAALTHRGLCFDPVWGIFPVIARHPVERRNAGAPTKLCQAERSEALCYSCDHRKGMRSRFSKLCQAERSEVRRSAAKHYVTLATIERACDPAFQNLARRGAATSIIAYNYL